jgi:hypothetical protein
MFGTIRKHQTWLWAVIITLTVISFVVYFSPYSRMNNTRGNGSYGVLNGETITAEHFRDAQREVVLQTFFNSGRWPDSFNEDLQREVYKWLLLVQSQERLGIHVGKEAAGLMAQNLAHSLERQGVTSPIMFVEKVLVPKGYSMDDFDRFCRHYFGIQELISAKGSSGKLLTPAEIKALYERNHQEVETEAVYFDATNYLAKVQSSPEVISQFFTNRMAAYRIPERVQVRYVRYELSNYLAQAETMLKSNLTEEVDAAMVQLGTNYTQLGSTPELAKAKVREQLIQRQAAGLARRKAQEFVGTVDEKTSDTNANVAAVFNDLAKANSLTVKLSPAFDRNDGFEQLSSLKVGEDFIRVAFSLSSGQLLAPVVSGLDMSSYAFMLEKQFPSEMPAFDAIRAKVVNDYKLLQATNLAWQAAVTFYSSATNGLAQGKTFSSLCAASQMKAVALAPFSISSQKSPEAEDKANLSELKQVAFGTAVGKVSTPVMGLDGFFMLHVKSRLPIDAAKAKTDLPAYTTYLRNRRSQEAFNIWFSHEAQKAFRNFEIFQQKAPPSMGAAKS